MCLTCHSMNNSVVLQQLQNSVDNPEFQKWNWTSFSHLSLSFLGINGEEAKILSKKLFEMYIEWSSGREISDTFFGNPPSEKIKFLYDRINEENLIHDGSSTTSTTVDDIEKRFVLIWKTAGEAKYFLEKSSLEFKDVPIVTLEYFENFLNSEEFKSCGKITFLAPNKDLLSIKISQDNTTHKFKFDEESFTKACKLANNKLFNFSE